MRKPEGGNHVFYVNAVGFKVGDTAPVKINKEPARLFWRDINTLVINGTDTRRVLHSFVQDGIRHFTCTDSDGTPAQIEVYRDTMGNVMVAEKQ